MLPPVRLATKHKKQRALSPSTTWLVTRTMETTKGAWPCIEDKAQANTEDDLHQDTQSNDEQRVKDQRDEDQRWDDEEILRQNEGWMLHQDREVDEQERPPGT
jgi:hypothetical protein